MYIFVFWGVIVGYVGRRFSCDIWYFGFHCFNKSPDEDFS